MKHACLSILLTLALLIAATGCENQQGDAGGGAAGRKLTIGVSVPAADHGWTAGVGWWAKRAMEMYPNVEWVYATADKPEKQIADVKDMMAQQKLDALVILATESAPVTPVAEEAAANNIYIVNVDRGFTKPVADLFIEGDNEAFGRKSAEFMVQKLKADGATADEPAKIIILRGIPSTVDTARYEAAMKVFNATPEVEVLAAQPGYWNQQKALEVTQNMLGQFDDVDAIWASDDDMAEGAEKAIPDARREDIWILGGAGKKEIIKRVMDRDPMYPADITYPPSMIAVGIHMAVANLRADEEKVSEFMPRHIKLDVELITPENAKRFYFPDAKF